MGELFESACPHGRSVHECEICQKIQEIQHAEPAVINGERHGHRVLMIQLPYGCYIAAAFVREGKELRTINFDVPEAFQKQGIGERLLRILSKKGKEFGAETLTGHITSMGALKTRKKVFGDRLVIHGPTGTLSYDEALRIGEEEDFVNYSVSVKL